MGACVCKGPLEPIGTADVLNILKDLEVLRKRGLGVLVPRSGVQVNFGELRHAASTATKRPLDIRDIYPAAQFQQMTVHDARQIRPNEFYYLSDGRRISVAKDGSFLCEGSCIIFLLPF